MSEFKSLGPQSLELINRVARVKYLVQTNLSQSTWFRRWSGQRRKAAGLPEPKVRPTDWLVAELVETGRPEDDAYRDTQARRVGACLRAALLALNKPGNKHSVTARDMESAVAHQYVDLSPLLPSIEGDESRKHFGSISFHRADEPTMTHHKESFSNRGFASLFGEDKPAVHRAIVRWEESLAQDPGPYGQAMQETLGATADLATNLIELRARVSESPEYFQSIISPLLKNRQSTYLAEANADVSLILLGLKRPSETDNERCDTAGNVVWLGKAVGQRMIEYLVHYQECRRCRNRTDGPCRNNVSFNQCIESLRQQLESFRSRYLWRRTDGGIRDSTRDLAELQLPFTFFGQPVLISSARAADGARGAISISLAAHPGFDDDELMFRWSTVAAMSLHQLVTDVAGVIVAIDQRVESERVRRNALRATVAGILGRSMAHDIGSHMLASMSTTDQAEMQWLRGYLRHRMVFVAEATTGDPFWQQALPLEVALNDIRYLGVRPRDEEQPLPSPVLKYLAASELDGAGMMKTVSFKLEYDGNLTLALPTGQIGAHALYCIVENAIRNGAKHGNKAGKAGKEMSVHLSVVPDPNYCGLLRATLWDDLSEYDCYRFHGFCEYFPPDVVQKWVREACEPAGRAKPDAGEGDNHKWKLVDDLGKPTVGGSGVKEMRIAAAWLRGHPLARSLLEEEIPGVLSPVLMQPVVVGPNGQVCDARPKSAKNHFIGVRFWLRAPKRLLVVSEEINRRLTKGTRAQLEKEGVSVVGDLPAAMEHAPAEYPMVLVDTRSLEEDHARQLSSDLRHELPLVLMLSQGLTTADEIPLCEELQKEEWESVVRSLIKGNRPMALWGAAYRWARKFLFQADAPADGVTIVVGLRNRSGSDSDATAAADRWAGQTRSRPPAGAPRVTWLADLPEAPPADLPAASLRGFDNHGSLVKLRNQWPATGQWKFYESYRSLSLTHGIVQYPPANPWDRANLLFAMEVAAFAKIGILDERTHTQVRERDQGHTLLGMGILARHGHEVTQPSREALQRFARSRPTKGMLVVLHQGILDKACKDRIQAKGVVGEMLETAAAVVVVSDRGQGLLEKLPPNARFLPYSVIESALRPEYESKLALTFALLSARSHVSASG